MTPVRGTGRNAAISSLMTIADVSTSERADEVERRVNFFGSGETSAQHAGAIEYEDVDALVGRDAEEAAPLAVLVDEHADGRARLRLADLAPRVAVEQARDAHEVDGGDDVDVAAGQRRERVVDALGVLARVARD